MEKSDYFADYYKDMETLESNVLGDVLGFCGSCNFAHFGEREVLSALNADVVSALDFAALLSPAAAPFLEQMAQRARAETQKRFGNSVYLFTPLYISNYCENSCVYCGFNCRSKIGRAQLDPQQIEREMQSIKSAGLEEILILTGESPQKSNLSYIGEACKIAQKYFRVVGLETYPVNTADYAYLHQCGADFVTVFQETYQTDTYAQVHPAGRKRIFSYRFDSQERALKGGMRGVGFGALLGLGEPAKDALATGLHAAHIQKKFPHAEISISCPRLRPISQDPQLKSNPTQASNKEFIQGNPAQTSNKESKQNHSTQNSNKESGLKAFVAKNTISEAQLLQIICAYRIFLPYASITISSRERAIFRDNVVSIAATKISAGVDVGIGGHSDSASKGGVQFQIDDGRTVAQIQKMLKKQALQPVMSEHIFL